MRSKVRVHSMGTQVPTYPFATGSVGRNDLETNALINTSKHIHKNWCTHNCQRGLHIEKESSISFLNLGIVHICI